MRPRIPVSRDWPASLPWTLFFLLAVTLLFPSAAAHGEGSLRHVSPAFGTIEPGGQRSFLAEFEEEGSVDGKFMAGWVFLIYGYAQNFTHPEAHLDVALRLDNESVAQWRWATNHWSLNTTTLPATSKYDLFLSNPTPHAVSYLFYFDQSCNCLAKPIVLPGGYALFNYEFRKGEKASFGAPLVPGWELKATLATRTGAGGVWPGDYRQIAETTKEGKGWLYLNWTAQETATHYILVQALKGVSFTGDPETGRIVDVTPLLERKSPKGVPGLEIVVLLGGLGAAALARRPR